MYFYGRDEPTLAEIAAGDDTMMRLIADAIVEALLADDDDTGSKQDSHSFKQVSDCCSLTG
jgi:hypothetical protein